MTRQIRDELLYEGERYFLNDEFLERFFAEFPDRKPRLYNGFTALWRGYIAVFELVNGHLYTKHINTFDGQSFDTDIIGEIFPRDRKCNWFSGLIRIDDFRGEFDDEEDTEAIFEFLEILNGELKKRWKLNFEDFKVFKDMQFEYFKNTSHYTKLYNLWRSNNPKMAEAEIDKYIHKRIIRNSREIF